ncbi:MAG: UDP-2-acetamido-2-deoxy-3-oxo-D-glucuronate aminotransferase [Candidatus Ordinivivax streblomastigis]|uniref:UDP-2-acetamido-2-deoxy-3-oxo-D-glucuronate aminotransferase n=1 Tax=Candidatus Ordinivivax streblomastigis TaxID=2540710 RepID=A0A5M8P1H2_9BACT|nr:MAG: UDP-2-acetamido-2-deoxy-3-oxo-D-glucuronate aminotransferase [Candidatus Ordinivivax streblomastigis]
MKPIQMVDLTTQYLRMQAEMDEAVLHVLRSGQYINGKAVESFADSLAQYTGSPYVIPCANGTDALQIALMSLDLRPADEVIVPAFNYIAAAEAIALLGLTPVLVDVHPQTFTIDVQKIEESISSNTKAIIPVHLFGQTADMETLMRIVQKYHLTVIEDNAQSIGASYLFSDGSRKQAGTIGNIGTLSFFPTKNLGGYGDGGAMLTNNESIAKKLKKLASHGQSEKYKHEFIGCNSRLDTIQAAILQVKLSYLDEFIAARKKVADTYTNEFKWIDWLETPAIANYSTHVFHQYTIQVKDGKRDDFQQYLQSKNIPSMVYYPMPLQNQPAFRNKIRTGSALSVTEKLCRSVLSLPMHTELDDEQMTYIIDTIKQY